MYENIISQEVCALLENDIRGGALPGALLFSGPVASGKLSCALESARILSCTADIAGNWNCSCPQCLKNKSLVSHNVLLAGPRDCTLEIAASRAAFEKAYEAHAPSENATRYLFLRSVRKLTMRFSPVLLQDDDKLSKIAVIVSEIDELMEIVDFPHELPECKKLFETCEKIATLCQKLEATFLYDSIPIKHIRNMSSWAHIKSSEGKKTVILENAERMNEGARNALLKILEEPPEDVVFILTTAQRSAVMPTILSRVRTYNFRQRTGEEQRDVVRRIFRNEQYDGFISEYMETFLPVQPDVLREAASNFFSDIANGKIPDVAHTVMLCGKFDVRLELRIFLDGIARAQKKLLASAAGVEASALCMDAIRQCWNDVAIYNQSPTGALENLTRTLSKINKLNGAVFRVAV
ncbi:MAG: DNA polymerase III [Treponema sp.]|nr:DNA polymerase III [Treponema sp.]